MKLTELIKLFTESRANAAQGTWENQRDIYIFAGPTMVADTHDEDAVLRARGVGGGMSVEQQRNNMNLCVLSANHILELTEKAEKMRVALEEIGAEVHEVRDKYAWNGKKMVPTDGAYKARKVLEEVGK